MSARIIPVEIVSDFVCPWCFLGRKRLLNALKKLPEIEVKLEARPFMLDPTLPEDGKPYRSYIRQRLGGQDRVDNAERQLIRLGKEEGIEYDFEAIACVPNTLNIHRVVYWADQADEGVQNRLIDDLFSRYFEQGENIAAPKILIDAAGKSGMRVDVVEKLLQTNVDIDTIGNDIALAQKIGVTGVPCFIIDKKYAIMGAQPADALADAISQIAEGFEPGGAEDH